LLSASRAAAAALLLQAGTRGLVEVRRRFDLVLEPTPTV